MGQVGSQAQNSDEQERSPSLARLVAIWLRVVLGLALAGEGGVIFADAQMHWAGHGAWMGIAAMALGALLGLWGIHGIWVQARGRAAGEQDTPLMAPEAAVPMLGALLVYKYRLVTEEQLAAALEIQRKAGPTAPRLGTILLEMGLVSTRQLQEALAHQRSLALGRVTSARPEEAGENEADRSDDPLALGAATGREQSNS